MGIGDTGRIRGLGDIYPLIYLTYTNGDVYLIFLIGIGDTDLIGIGDTDLITVLEGKWGVDIKIDYGLIDFGDTFYVSKLGDIFYTSKRGDIFYVSKRGDTFYVIKRF